MEGGPCASTARRRDEARVDLDEPRALLLRIHAHLHRQDTVRRGGKGKDQPMRWL
jgi:hypothetical protein